MATTGKVSEAQRIVDDLVDRFGMQGAAIAREIGVKADTITNIKLRRATGNLQVTRLRILRDQLAGAADVRKSSQSDEPSSAPLIEQLPPVADLFAPVQQSAEPSALTLNAEEPEPAPKRGFFDGLRAAMLGEPSLPSSQPGMSAPSRSGGSKSDKGDAGSGPKEDFVAKLTPIAALLFVLYIQSRIHDPYKPVAPRQDEMQAILAPWMTWFAKQLDIRGKLTEDANLALASILAASLYGVRAYETYQVIHAEEVQRVRSDNRPPAGAAFVAASGGGPTHAAATPADAGAGRGVSDANAPLPLWRGDARVTRQAARPAGREPRGEPATPEQRRADASIDALLAADHAGRQRLGL